MIRNEIATMKPTARSRITNARFKNRVTSKALWADVDGRTPWARRYRDLLALFADDCGGLDMLTELKLSLCRRAAALTVECEKLEGTLAQGGEVDIDMLARISSHLRRIAESIGLNRVKRDVTPTLDALVAKHSAPPQRGPLARESNARATNEPQRAETHRRGSQP